MRGPLLFIVVVAAAVIAFTSRGNSKEADAAQAPVEYKVIPTSEFGITGTPGNAILDYQGATAHFNELAKDGWRFCAVIDAGGPSAMLMQRTK